MGDGILLDGSQAHNLAIPAPRYVADRFPPGLDLLSSVHIVRVRLDDILADAIELLDDDERIRREFERRRLVATAACVLGAETVANQLSQKANLRGLGRRFFREVRRDEVLKMLEPARLETYVTNTRPCARAPGRCTVLSDLADDRFTVRVIGSESTRMRRAENGRARLLATAIISVSLALLLAIQTLPTVAGVPLHWILAIALALVYLSIVVQWRRLR
jgi:hypothetical protein